MSDVELICFLKDGEFLLSDDVRAQMLDRICLRAAGELSLWLIPDEAEFWAARQRSLMPAAMERLLFWKN